MKLLSVLITILFVTAATSCREEWSDDRKKQYMESCLMQGHFSDSETNQRYCECDMGVVMKHYISLDEIITNADSTEVSKEIYGCITKTISK